MVDAIHQWVQVPMHESVEPISLCQRFVETHQRLVALVDLVERLDLELDGLHIRGHDCPNAVHDEQSGEHEQQQQHPNRHVSGDPVPFQHRNEGSTDVCE